MDLRISFTISAGMALTNADAQSAGISETARMKQSRQSICCGCGG